MCLSMWVYVCWKNVIKISHVWLSIQKIALLENDESLANQSTFEQNMKNK